MKKIFSLFVIALVSVTTMMAHPGRLYLIGDATPMTACMSGLVTSQPVNSNSWKIRIGCLPMARLRMEMHWPPVRW